jgi:hypothetical protein
MPKRLPNAHGLSSKTERRLLCALEKNLESDPDALREFIWDAILAFVDLMPIERGEKSRWRLQSDRAVAACEFFLIDALTEKIDPLFGQARAIFESSAPGSFSRDFNWRLAGCVLSYACERRWPALATLVGERLDQEPEPFLSACISCVVEMMLQAGFTQQNGEGFATPADEQGWSLLWAALGPKARLAAGAPELWAPVFDAEPGRMAGSHPVPKSLHSLALLSKAMEFCVELRPMFQERLMRPDVFPALADALSMADGRDTSVDNDSPILLGIARRFFQNLPLSAAHWAEVAASARRQVDFEGSPLQCPRILALCEQSVLSAEISEAKRQEPFAPRRRHAQL